MQKKSKEQSHSPRDWRPSQILHVNETSALFAVIKQASIYF